MVVVIMNMMGNEYLDDGNYDIDGKNGGGDPRNTGLEWLHVMDPIRSFKSFDHSDKILASLTTMA
jgi:hypothetical protein